MDFSENIKQKGEVEIIIDYVNGKQERRFINNTILRTSKYALAKALVNIIDTPFDFYISNMLFGTNGADAGVPKFVDDTRNGLFGPVLLNKPVISQVNQLAPNQAIFTGVILFSEGNGNTINEFAIQMKNGDLYSMITSGGIAKTSSMQVTIIWRISMI